MNDPAHCPSCGVMSALMPLSQLRALVQGRLTLRVVKVLRGCWPRSDCERCGGPRATPTCPTDGGRGAGTDEPGQRADGGGVSPCVTYDPEVVLSIWLDDGTGEAKCGRLTGRDGSAAAEGRSGVGDQ